MTSIPSTLFQLKPNPDWAELPKFNRKDWTAVRFGDVVKFPKETIDPTNGELERYIAGDHMESEDVHLRRWGKVGDGYLGPAFIRRFREGQVLYGSRRTYLKKVAYAEFDGITANTTFVLESVQNKLHQPLLPWIMLSQRFTEHSIRESKGSTNPYINFPDIAKFEFNLPPLDQQKRIAEILWAVDSDEQAKASLSNRMQILLEATLEEELDRMFAGPCLRLDQILLSSPESGSSAPPSPTDTGHFVLSLTALSQNGYLRGNLKSIPPTKQILDCRLSSGDFLISRSNTRELVGLVGIFDEDRNDVSFPDTMMRLPVNETLVSKKFLEVVLLSRRGRLHMMRSAAGTSESMKKINRQTLGNFLVPTPSLMLQEKLLDTLRPLREAVSAISSASRSSNALKFALLESLL